jgi:hypothetical protein
VLRSYVREEFDEEVVVLLCSSPLAVIGCRILELDALECRFDLGGIRVLVKPLRVVYAASGAAEAAVSSEEPVRRRGTRRECDACGSVLGAFVAFGSVLDELDGFPVAAVDDGCY